MSPTLYAIFENALLREFARGILAMLYAGYAIFENALLREFARGILAMLYADNLVGLITILCGARWLAASCGHDQQMAGRMLSVCSKGRENKQRLAGLR